MWAAANDGAIRRRRHDKRRRTDNADGKDTDGAKKLLAADDNDIGSESDSDISSDGERSTTESVHEGEASGGNVTGQSSTQEDGVEAGQHQPAQLKKRKRKHKNKKKKKKEKKIREETPEATMARLKSSYSAAMAAVGALHRASKQYCTHWKEEEKKKDTSDGSNAGVELSGSTAINSEMPETTGLAKSKGSAAEGDGNAADTNETNSDTLDKPSNDNEQTGDNTNVTKENKQQEVLSTIRRVAQAARTALEQSLLMDHIILAPILLPDKKIKKGKKQTSKDDSYENDSAVKMSSAWLDVWSNSSKDISTAVPPPASNDLNERASAAVCQISLTKWNRLSAAHRTVIRQVSYLALVNYADLLLCGCTCHRSTHASVGVGKESDALDRGAVSNLDVLALFTPVASASGEPMDDGVKENEIDSPPVQSPSKNGHSTSCLWCNESKERTIRLAVAAYCDASELDPTDPTLWFKLACAARALGWEVDSSSSKVGLVQANAINGPPISYRCLERLALERGISSLPPGVPPNRLLMRAWREMENWDRMPSTVSHVAEESEKTNLMEDEVMPKVDECPIELVLHMPRYSWTTLGRILMRACREGVSYGRVMPDAFHHVWSTNCQVSEDYAFGSPLVDIRISPLLAIPPGVLGRISEFLEEPTGIKRLKCTCRAMPFELDFARAKITEEKSLDLNSDKDIGKGCSSTVSEANLDVSCPGKTGKTAEKDTGAEELPEVPDTNTKTAPKSGDRQRKGNSSPVPPRGRVSKRVRTQMITTEKKTERKTKRGSVQYCLLAGTLSCTAANPDYNKSLKVDLKWDDLPLIRKCMQAIPALSQAFIEGYGVDQTGTNHTDNNTKLGTMKYICAFLAPTSLHAFVTKWSRNNSGPRNCVEMFLKHVSLNTADVFGTEMTDSLSLCVMECFDMMISTGGTHTELTPWYGPESAEHAGNLDIACQTLAVNLLNAELRLKRCESHDITSQEYKEDSDLLAFIIPNLLVFAPAVSQLLEKTSVGTGQKVLELQCRCYWLASSYYLWISRCSNDASISKSAEDNGIAYLNKAIELLSGNHQHDRIKTPHLESLPDRRGEHWSGISAEVLSKYKEQLQSSSIVSRSRQSFQDIGLGIKERAESAGHAIDNFSEDDKIKLASLGAELLERYNVNSEKSSEVFDELLSDFLLLHEKHLHLPDDHAPSGQVRWGDIWSKIPSSQVTFNLSVDDSRPSIVQVLASSLLASNEKIPQIFLIYSKLVLTALLLQTQSMLKESSDGTQIDLEEKSDGPLNDVSETSHVKRDHLLRLFVNFFIDKMTDMIHSYAHEPEMMNTVKAYLEGEDLSSLIFASINLASNLQMVENPPQIHSFLSVSRLVQSMRDIKGLPRQAQDKVERVYFVAMVRALISQRKDFSELVSSVNDKRTKKWQTLITSKADVIFHTANEFAELLSLNPSTVNADGIASLSHLIKAIIGEEREQPCQPATLSSLAQLSEALLYFWRFLTNKFDVSSPTETLLKNRLMVPISSAMIALCGSPGISLIGSGADEKSERSALSFSDYFDSENSVNGLFLPDESAAGEDQRPRRVMLRKICQLTQCVSLVFRSVNEKLICQNTNYLPFPSSQYGPFLPLVVTRICYAMSDLIFQLFSEDGQEAYPYGARECGNTIDDLLGKAYFYLYGFSFSGLESDTTKKHAPESINAAKHIFHCIKRVYHDNRKTPPNKAFETIELALPPGEESEASKSIKAFLFDAHKNTEVASIITRLPSAFPEWVLNEVKEVRDEHQDTISMLRRGVAHELAKGSITHLDSSQKSPSDMDDPVGLSEERELTQSHELSLHQKFKAVLDDLCYNPNNSERWIVLSECLGFKAEYICDRLPRIQETYDHSEFFLSTKSKMQRPSVLSLDQLRNKQTEEFQESRTNWKPFIGNDLRFYMQYPWSNLSSLQACAKEIGSTIPPIDVDDNQTDGHNSDYPCWKEIESMYERGDYVSWANSWGGMFIFALRKMRLRALLVARHLAMKCQEGMHPSEVSEDVGTALYGELMASTVYGYPMHPMTLHEKRAIADCSKFYFQEAVELSTSSDYIQKCQTISWELNFMIGKCYEKSASTLKDEMYSVESLEGGDSVRLYETVMTDAIRNYSKAFTDAQFAEQSSGGPDKTCIGGSSHGALECLYRLHATRLKVLLTAIRRVKEECELAEQEAFRITCARWFDESNESSSSAGVRGKTWDIFADCVDALSHCRREIPLFHRAAYRLAQAYNYAPAFHNPDCDLSLGSKQAVPTIKAYKIRGLDTDSCADSASIAISKLFEKKRAQICAVWVTTSTAPCPFEVLNDSERKYDSLRLKYIKAYVDCMYETKRKDKIVTLLNWATASNQDLPSFYEASATLRGGDPGKHTKLSLLKGSGRGFMTKVKRSATIALSQMILKDLAVMKKNGVDSEGKTILKDHFKLAYTVFTRLNSSCKEAAEFVKSNNPLPEAEALCKCYLSIQSGYRISSIHFDDMDAETYCSILEGAASKAKAMIQGAKTTPKKDKE